MIECGVVYHMNTIYKNCELEATRQWMQGDTREGETAVFYSAYDLDDGYEIICAYGDYLTCSEAIKGMKEEIDNYKRVGRSSADD